MSTAPVLQFDTPAIETDETTPGQDFVAEAEKGASLSVEPIIPGSLLLGALRDPRLRVVEAFRVSFSTEDGSVRAHAEEIDEFGFGSDYSDSLADLQHTVSELYWSLAEDEDRLGIDLLRVWRTLQKKILKRDAVEAA